MTDKSFGEHVNRNIVKNPLLSSAVTGLCFEDLSNIAVLLPVSQAQEAITRPEPTGPKNIALSDPNNAKSYPSGDANTNFNPFHPSNLTSSPLDITQTKDKQNEKPNVSKASGKSADKFDVNEYFARLQGTRYVSAPLNSMSREDKNANLDATEDNLEEINLNDDKPIAADVPQSFTSDIAQNFSQLPTVLPQVASAVFSSFSNMLSMKSREQTPDVTTRNQALGVPGGYQEVQFESQRTEDILMAKEDVPMMEVTGLRELKEVVPKERPAIGTSGTTNYRLPTKKKYAQIPGLSSSDRAQIPSYNPVPVGPPNVPPYFVPTSSNTQKQDQLEMQNTQNVQANFSMVSSQNIGNQYNQQDVDQAKTFDSLKSSFNIFNPNKYTPTVTHDVKNITSTTATSYETDGLQTQSTPTIFPLQQGNAVSMVQGTMSSSGVIPPPPMFSNANRDMQSSQSGVGTTILPPSVARRISGRHPVMKPQTQTTPFTQNIFVPEPISDAEYKPEKVEKNSIGNFELAETTNFQQPSSAFAPYGMQASAAFMPGNTPAVDSKLVADNSAYDIASQKDSTSATASMLPLPPKSFQGAAELKKLDIDTYTVLPPPPKSMPIGANIQRPESIAPPLKLPVSSSPEIAHKVNTVEPSRADISSSAPISRSTMPSNVSSEVIITSDSQDSIAPPPMMFAPSSVPSAMRPPLLERMPLKPESSAMNQEAARNLPPPPTFFDPYNRQTTSDTLKTTGDESKLNPGNLPPPPVFFNPNTVETPGVPVMAHYSQNIPLGASQFQSSTYVEPPKVIPEPPKDVGNLSYRMTKKKLQYYAGPIIGIGAISNNVKPVIPSVDIGASPSALFVPTPIQQTENVENVPQPNFDQYTVPIASTAPIIDQYSVPFDLSRTAGNATSITAIEHPKNTVPIQQNYNTVFDVSRSPTDMYENTPPQKPESTGFGIIGSLKSKLGALDINKIQSSVTTFFDPAYNNVKKEASDTYGSTTNMPSFEHYAHSGGNQSSNFEIFVPTVEQQPIYGQGIEQQMYPIVNPTQTQESQQNYQTQYLYSHYPNQGQNYPPFSYYSADQYVAPINAPVFNQCRTTTSSNQPNIPGSITHHTTAATELDKIRRDTFISPSTAYTQDNNEKTMGNTDTKMEKHTDKDASARYFFETVPQKVKESTPESIFNIVTTEQVDFESGSISAKKLPEASSHEFEEFLVKENISKGTTPNILNKKEDLIDSKTVDFNQTEGLGDLKTLHLGNFHENIRLDKSADSSMFECKPTYESITALQLASRDEDNSKSPFFVLKSDNSLTCAAKIPLEDLVSKILGESEGIKQATGYGWKEEECCSENKENVIDSGNGSINKSINELKKLSEKKLGDSRDIVPKDVPSTPLCGLSTMLANKSKELEDLKQDMGDWSLHETTRNIDTIFNRGSNVSFFEIDSKNASVLHDSQESPDLNICETCREVNLPDSETTDLTKQLIENITSPIQLSNPVEVPLPESDILIPDPGFFDRNQFEEISHITEETIETIQVQSATELLVDKLLDTDIGWCADKPVIDKATEPDYISQDPLKTIGFLGGSSLFLDSSILPIPKNASDELKAEYKGHEESPVILSRQMSIPSAPPLEDEDNKSDDTIDVHSIEQDASKDFPVEEFVIEPSETDDDKIEFREKENSNVGETPDDLESFATRMEKYKQLDEIVNQVVEPILGFSPTSPSLPIASYFDTGNYAADTHYKNLCSPPQMPIPPGFEEEYQRRLSGLSNSGIQEKYINDPISDKPDSSTLTRPVHSSSFSTTQNKQEKTKSKNDEAKTDSYPVFDLFGVKKEEEITPRQSIFGSLTFSLTDKIVTENNPNVIGYHEPVKPPMMADLFGAGKEDKHIPHRLDTFSSFSQQKKLAEDEFRPTVIPDIFNEPTEISNEGLESFSTYNPKAGHKEVVKTETIPNLEKLPDPLNFFSNTEPTTQSTVDDNSCNRLASYFALPSQTAPSKPFFELSQGQDHYRQHFDYNLDSTNPGRHGAEASANKKPEDLTSKTSNLIENKLDENKYSNNPFNIPQTQYIANLNLIKDLTLPQNLKIDPEQTVKTVNYFTVEYDTLNPSFIKELNIGEPKHQTKDTDIKERCPDCDSDDKTLNSIINNCKLCCDFNRGYVTTYFEADHESLNVKNFKAKQCMDNANTDGEREKPDSNMEVKTDKSQYVTLPMEPSQLDDDSRVSLQSGENRTNAEYTPVKHHWFYRVDVEGKSIWRGFSVCDSQALEQAFNNPELNEETRVATDGGRFDVNIVGRLRIPVYWKAKPTNVRRCSWFYKGTTDARYVPYTENVANLLEEEYHHGLTTGEWHRRLMLPSNEMVVMHGPAVMVHFQEQDARDSFSAAPSRTSKLFELTFGKSLYRSPDTLKIRVPKDQTEKVDHLLFLVHGAGEYKKIKGKIQSAMRPRVVRRGSSETEIEDIEPSNIDHLLLLCHGVGSACDMRFRSVEEVVDDFRVTSSQLLQSHYRSAYDNGVVGRVEVLPISWHETLHSGETGVDHRLAWITLDSIPRLRNFTNDTVLDVLFYTSPVFCQTIIDTVCSELNRIYKVFRSRNPNFSGGVSLGGHSLGSVILYDLLCHQNDKQAKRPPRPVSKQPSSSQANEEWSKKFIPGIPSTGQHTIDYPHLDFSPVAMYALGSPIAIFECIRGVESLGLDFKLPTCQKFFNIFHPYDPIAYRLEPLVNQQLKNVKPYLIPHHKGRKRMHLELKDTMARVGADIKQKLMESIKNTWANVWRTQPTPIQLEKVVEEELEREQLREGQEQTQDDEQPSSEMLGRLNDGRRIDYVLQEAPFEMINEYLFAMSSHVCYWESEDTMLLMLREVYDAMGIQPDSTVPQPNLTVQRTRTVMDGSIGMNVADNPSTSRGGDTRL